MTKQEFGELMSIKGEMRGISLKSYGEFILRNEGEKGLKKMEDAISDLGYNFKYRKVRVLSDYPLGLEAVTLELIKRLFNYDAKKIEAMGRAEFRSPIIMRLFMKYFLSLEKAAQYAQRMWSEHFSIGNIEVTDIDKQKQSLIIRVRNFDLRRSSCESMTGVFASAVENIVGKNVSCQETKCTFEGDDCHEFLLKW